jgi:hypothetical protein
MTVQEFQARKTERIAIAVAHYVATTPADKLDWCPATGEESCTRSVLDQASECVVCNRMIACMLGGEQFEDPVSITDAGIAQTELRKSAAEVAAAIRALPDEALNRSFTLQMMTLSGEVLIDMPCRNMTYHGGQINLIQLLLGDKEFHMAPAAFK